MPEKRSMTKEAEKRGARQQRPVGREAPAAQYEEPDLLALQRAVARPDLARSCDILALQGQYGNRRVQRLLDGRHSLAPDEKRRNENQGIARPEGFKGAGARRIMPVGADRGAQEQGNLEAERTIRSADRKELRIYAKRSAGTGGTTSGAPAPVLRAFRRGDTAGRMRKESMGAAGERSQHTVVDPRFKHIIRKAGTVPERVIQRGNEGKGEEEEEVEEEKKSGEGMRLREVRPGHEGELNPAYIEGEEEERLRLRGQQGGFTVAGQKITTANYRSLAIPAQRGNAIFVMTVDKKIYVADQRTESVEIKKTIHAALAPLKIGMAKQRGDVEAYKKMKGYTLYSQEETKEGSEGEGEVIPNILAFLGGSAGVLFYHTSFNGAKPVAGAGEMKFDKGELVLLTDKSGHYQPTVAETKQVVEELSSRGVDIEKLAVRLYALGGRHGKLTTGKKLLSGEHQ